MRRNFAGKRLVRGGFLSLFFACHLAAAQAPAALPDAPKPSAPADEAAATMFPHSETSRYYIAGQANIIFQADGPFHSPYEGPNSFIGRGEYKVSLLGTLYLGAQLRRAPKTETDAIFNLESSGGRGLSEALGLAGFTNLDVVRNPNLGSVPYMARVQLHQTIGFTDKLIESPRTPFSLATQVPERRLQFFVGKMSLPDYLDINSIGSDSHLQFMNWTVDNNGAWDYAADTRGYTYAVVTEYDDKVWSVRYARGVDAYRCQWHGSGLESASRQRPKLGVRTPQTAPRQAASTRAQGVVRVLSYRESCAYGSLSRGEPGLCLGRRPDAQYHRNMLQMEP